MSLPFNFYTTTGPPIIMGQIPMVPQQQHVVVQQPIQQQQMQPRPPPQQPPPQPQQHKAPEYLSEEKLQEKGKNVMFVAQYM
jgi:hypothetical protein